jgi:SAM-dependent methyltransferase
MEHGQFAISPILELGDHPMADTFVKSDGDKVNVYPLELKQCLNCGHIQTTVITSAKERYVDTEYSYTSSNSGTSRNHWIEFAKSTSDLKLIGNDHVVLEIGSNDGFMLEQYRNRGWQVLGIDASPVMTDICEKKGIACLIGVVGETELLKGESNLYDLVVANNVFNHANNPVAFVNFVKRVMKPDGYFIFEVPYWLASIKSGHFEQIYHEHVNYYLIKALQPFFQKEGLTITHVELVDYHGVSIRVFVRWLHIYDADETVVQFIHQELDAKLFDYFTYRDFEHKIFAQSVYIDCTIDKLIAEGKTVVAIGAAAKGNTWLNYHKLDASMIKFVTDASESKIGKFTPHSNIPIVSDKELHGMQNVVAIILSWNIAEQIKQSLLKINPTIQFLEV